MVALKRWRENLPDGTIVVKQERRGGIETGEGDEDTPSRRKKQERRGGIETSGLSSPRTRERYGSRNAVVALKRPRTPPSASDGRGEAGTPWWH